MNKITFVLLVLLVIVQTSVFAQNKEYHCQFSKKEIVVDGKADDGIWQEIEAVSFVANEDEPLKAKSTFKAAWDEKFVYFYFWMEDKDVVGEMTKRDDHIWNEEVMEIFLDADCNPKTYYEFEWNPLNTLLDLYVLNPNCTRDVIRQWWKWDCEGIRSAVQIDGTLNNSNDTDKGWSLEVAIPFSEIQTAANIPAKAGDVWRFDLTRREGTEKQGTLQKSSWLPPSCHFPLSYGKLIFEK